MPRRLVKLKTAGEWQDGDHTMLHVIFEPSLEMQEFGDEPPDIGADFDHSGSRGVMADPDPPPPSIADMTALFCEGPP